MPDSPANDEEYAPGTRAAPGSERSAEYQMVRRSFGLDPAMIRARKFHGHSRVRGARLVGDAMIPYPCDRLTQCRTCRPQALANASPSAATDASPHQRRSRAGFSLASVLLALLGNLLTACALSPYPPFDFRQADHPCTSQDAPCKGVAPCKEDAPCKGGQHGMQKGVHHNEAGDYFAFYPASLAETTTAAKKSLQQLGMEYDAQTIDTPSRIVIEGMSVDHYIVKVTLEGINQDQTKATIHANYYGEKTLSLRFQHLLAKDLKVSSSKDPAR